MSGNHHPTPPPRSPWSSPVVIGAIVAGVLMLTLAVLLGFLLIPSDEDSPSGTESSSTTTRPQVSTHTVTAEPSTVTSTAAPTTRTTTTTRSTTTPRTTAGPQPNVPGTDQHGFVSGPRCNSTGDPVVMVGQTDRSKIVVCQVGNQTGRYYYKGLADGMTAEIDYPTRSGDTFFAAKNEATYQISPAALTITANGDVVAVEPMIYYWTN